MGHGGRSGGGAPSGAGGRTAAGGAAAGSLAGGVVGAATGGGVQAGMLGSAETLMSLATDLAAGSIILAPAPMISFQFKLCSGKPQNIMKAAYGWDDAADLLQKASTELQDLVAALPQQTWAAQDRERYENTVQEYTRQLDYLHEYCNSVSISLTILAWALFGYAIFAIGMATWLAALAAAAVDSILLPECQAAAAGILEITIVATAALGAAGAMAGTAFTAGADFVADNQGEHGNQYAEAALQEAFKSGGKTAMVNLVQDGINAGLAYADRTGVNENKKLALNGIDLDADRDGEGTWNIGAGVQGKVGPVDLEPSGHINVNDGHPTGGDLELRGKHQLGETAHAIAGGGKLEWGKPGGNDGPVPDSFTGGGGYENTATGSKAGVEGGYREGDWEGKLQGGSTSGTAEVGGSTKKPEKAPDETPPWDR